MLNMKNVNRIRIMMCTSVVYQGKNMIWHKLKISYQENMPIATKYASPTLILLLILSIRCIVVGKSARSKKTT